MTRWLPLLLLGIAAARAAAVVDQRCHRGLPGLPAQSGPSARPSLSPGCLRSTTSRTGATARRSAPGPSLSTRTPHAAGRPATTRRASPFTAVRETACGCTMQRQSAAACTAASPTTPTAASAWLRSTAASSSMTREARCSWTASGLWTGATPAASPSSPSAPTARRSATACRRRTCRLSGTPSPAPLSEYSWTVRSRGVLASQRQVAPFSPRAGHVHAVITRQAGREWWPQYLPSSSAGHNDTHYLVNSRTELQTAAALPLPV